MFEIEIEKEKKNEIESKNLINVSYIPKGLSLISNDNFFPLFFLPFPFQNRPQVHVYVCMCTYDTITFLKIQFSVHYSITITFFFVVLCVTFCVSDQFGHRGLDINK